MATKKCSICNKGSMKVGNRVKLRGKFNLTKQSAKKPNLQSTTLSSGEKILACTKCIKAMGKTK